MERPSQALLTYTADTMERACNDCSAASIGGRAAVARQHRRMVAQQITGTADLYNTVFARKQRRDF